MGLVLSRGDRVVSPNLTTSEAAVYLCYDGTPVARALKQRGLLGAAGRLNLKNDAKGRALRAECRKIEGA